MPCYWSKPASSARPDLNILKLLLVAGGYAAVAWLSLGFAELQRNTSPVWPPSGLAMAALFWWGARFAPSIAVGSWLVNFLVLLAITPDRPLVAAVAAGFIAFANAGEGLLAARMLRVRAAGEAFCHTGKNAASFLFFVVLLPPCISALVGVTSLVAGGFSGDGHVSLLLLTWFTGNVAGLLIFGPAALLRWRRVTAGIGPRRVWEAVALVAALIFAAHVMTGVARGPLLPDWPGEYLVLPIIIWAVFRFREAGTAIALLLLSFLAIGGTRIGFEVFPSPLPGHALLYLQLFLAVIAAMAWLVCGKVNELIRINARLEEIVVARTLDQRRALREREANLAIAAHDLRVPLVGIRNLLGLFKKHHPDVARPGQGELLQQAIDAAAQANALAARLLEPQRLAVVVPEPEPVDWVQLVAGVVERAKLLAEPLDVSLRFLCESAELPGRVDSIRLLQVLENLTHNALKFSPGHSAVTVTLAEQLGTVVMTIGDSGPGIPAEVLPWIFSTVGLAGRIDPRATSSGIGLFIVGKLVRQLGGVITCESTRGKGTLFTLRLPVEPRPAGG